MIIMWSSRGVTRKKADWANVIISNYWQLWSPKLEINDFCESPKPWKKLLPTCPCISASSEAAYTLNPTKHFWASKSAFWQNSNQFRNVNSRILRLWSSAFFGQAHLKTWFSIEYCIMFAEIKSIFVMVSKQNLNCNYYMNVNQEEKK